MDEEQWEYLSDWEAFEYLRNEIERLKSRLYDLEHLDEV